jgi:uncharacterized protein YbbC (DUF1343 family)
MAEKLEQAGLPGVHFVPTRFTPASSLHAGKTCTGVRLLVTDPGALQPVRVGLELARVLKQMYPTDFAFEQVNFLLANESTLRALERGESSDAVERAWEPVLSDFLQRRAPCLLY